MSALTMRDEFEAWYLRRFGKCDMQSGWAMERWEAWQASRAALTIELPKITLNIHCDAQGYMRTQCRQAIEAAGVKVKP
jgi:hypothetical protein